MGSPWEATGQNQHSAASSDSGMASSVGRESEREREGGRESGGVGRERWREGESTQAENRQREQLEISADEETAEKKRGRLEDSFPTRLERKGMVENCSRSLTEGMEKLSSSSSSSAHSLLSYPP